MKKKLISTILVFCMVLSMLPVMALADTTGSEDFSAIPELLDIDQSPAISSNKNDWDYSSFYCPPETGYSGYDWADVVNSYLNANADGGFTRIEYIEDKVYIEEYDKNLAYVSSRVVEPELPIFGGYYTDGNYNFLVFGQKNPYEDGYMEIMRVVRYSLDWTRIDSASVYGANTTTPFYGGTLKMLAMGDFLYIRTSHIMYTWRDGLRHQANMGFIVRISDMQVVYEATAIGHNWHYVSHSFDQFMIYNDGYIVTADLGDGYPRAVILHRADIFDGKLVTSGGDIVRSATVMSIAGETGDNYTGVSIGGLEASSDHYIVAGKSIKQYIGTDRTCNIFVSTINFGSTPNMIWFTDYDEDDDRLISTPQLVKIDNDNFCLMWTENESRYHWGGWVDLIKGPKDDTLYYVFLNGSGEAISEVYSSVGELSDCHPIISNGEIVWYVTDSLEPVFYSIDIQNPSYLHTHETHVHDYVSNKVTKPTCTKPGYTTYTCSCGYSYVDDHTDALGHNLTDWEVAYKPTLYKPGEEARICLNCFYEEWRVLPPLSHVHKYTAIVTNPTCTEEGYTTHSCTCSDSYKDNIVPPTGHKWDTGKVTKEPVEGVDGEKTFTCTVCGETEIRYFGKGEPEPIQNPFRDVAAKDFFYEPVMWAVSNNVTSGLSANSFGPTKGCTRAQVVTFLWRAAGEPAPTSDVNPFTDVKKGQYYYDAVLWAVENGITTGLNATTFGTNADCNRGQIVTFLWRAMGKPAPTNTNNPFKDVSAKQYYYDAVLWAVENGITTGLSATSFGPNSTCTRGQIVTFLYRAYK